MQNFAQRVGVTVVDERVAGGEVVVASGVKGISIAARNVHTQDFAANGTEVLRPVTEAGLVSLDAAITGADVQQVAVCARGSGVEADVVEAVDRAGKVGSVEQYPR